MKRIFYYTIAMFFALIIIPFMIAQFLGGNNNVDNYDNENLKNESNELSKENKEIKSSENKIHKTDNISIKVLDNEHTIDMDLEEYVIGVVGAEMPVNFNTEALKAQAVAARTFAIGRKMKTYSADAERHNQADICSDYAHCQAWKPKDRIVINWNKDDRETLWAKIENAVYGTSGEVMKYKDVIINPLYHSSSGGVTEDIKDVWSDVNVPYLVSVISLGEENSSNYINTTSINKKDFINILKKEYADIIFKDSSLIDEIEVKDLTSSKRVKSIKVGNKIISGTIFRKLFNLNSTYINIENKEDCININTRGHGHGVGMSQWGANFLAKDGKTYEQILKHYYKGVEIKGLKNE